MKEIDLFAVNKFTAYQSADELPAVRYKDFQKYLLMDAGIGSTMADVNDRMGALLRFLGAKKYEEATREAENLYYTHYSIVDTLNYTQMAFGALLYSINGVVLTDFSADKIKGYIEELSGYGLQQFHVSQLVDDVKKNSDQN